jgi:hypothetical protein
VTVFGTVPLGVVAFGLSVPFGFTVFGASTPFVLVPLGTVVPFGATTVPFEPTPVGETPLGEMPVPETPLGDTPPTVGLTPFGATVVPELRLFAPGVVTVLAPALLGTTVLFVPVFICCTWASQPARNPGNRLWQLVPGG